MAQVVSDDEEDEPELSALDFVTDKLLSQLQWDGFHGCSPDKHTDELVQHLSTEPENHYSLDEVFNNPGFPSVLKQDELLTAERLQRLGIPS